MSGIQLPAVSREKGVGLTNSVDSVLAIGFWGRICAVDVLWRREGRSWSSCIQPAGLGLESGWVGEDYVETVIPGLVLLAKYW
jgi:hypothetical protein